MTGGPEAGQVLSRTRWAAVVLAGISNLAVATLAGASEPKGPPPVYGYEVVNTFPHDASAFCQGLAFADGMLYEGTGRYRQSTLRKVDLKSGRVVQLARLTPNFFGEGIAIHGDRIVQLTWRSGIGLVYEKKTFRRQATFRYRGEGWGITSDGKRLIVSNGSSTLAYLDPRTFRAVGQLAVRSQGRPVGNLNELEYVEGEIYANIWGQDYIARISPESGEVVGWIDLRGLLKPQERSDPDAVLNGIAYDPEQKRLLVTGKLWPKLFEIKVVARQ